MMKHTWNVYSIPFLKRSLWIACIFSLTLGGCTLLETDLAPSHSSAGQTTTNEVTEVDGEYVPSSLLSPAIRAADLPDYEGIQVIDINNNKPEFTQIDPELGSFEYYGQLDDLGRCTIAVANAGQDLMPQQKRGDISSVKPTGFRQNFYQFVDGEAVYNRAHLIAHSIAGEDANPNNLITGTRSLNLAMIPYENEVSNYIRKTGNHVLYRVTPVFEGDDLVAEGVLMEAQSVEDHGEGVSFCKFIYNVEPGVEIDYATGENWLAEEDTPTWELQTKDTTISQSKTPAQETTYIGNRNSQVFHDPSCKGVKKMAEKNKVVFTSRNEAIAQGYEPCKSCNP